MFNFETVWRKNHRLEGLIIHYEKQAKQDAFKIMQLQDIIKNLEIELTQAKAKIYELDPKNKWFTDQNIVIKPKKNTKSKKGTN